MKKVYLLIALFICTISYANNDKYRLILSSDPATTMMISWNQISGSNPIVYYDTVDYGNSDHTLYTFSKTVDRSTSYMGMENQFAGLSGLIPDTNYYFIINDSEGNSQRFWFRTAPSDLSRLSFIAGGDSRNNRVPRQNANLLVSKLKPHAVIFGGDMTDAGTDAEWQDWMDDWQLTTASNGRMFPIIPARGNHESTDKIYNLFNTTSSSDAYYAITFGNNLFRIYTLNTEISVSGNQLTWLENDIAANSLVLWKSAQNHKPMRPHYTGKEEGIDRYNAWAQLFYDNGVRLVMESDTHTVKTTWPVEPYSGAGNDEGFIRNDLNGTIYVGEGCWGAPTRAADDAKEWTRNMGQFNQFKLIFVSETEIEIRTIDVDNASSVGENSDNDPFTLPVNLNVWNPSNGDVVTILPASLPSKPVIEFASGTRTNYSDGTNLIFNIDVLDIGDGITKVDFYIDGALTNTDVSSPYSFTNTYTDGNYIIEAIATDNSGGVSLTAQIIINIGDFTSSEYVAIITGNDDIEERQDESVYFDSSDLELIYDGTTNGYQKVGLRFQDVNIPQGATISNAYIQFMADGDWTNANAEYNIYVENTNNAETFENNSTSNLTGRIYMGAAINWKPISWADNDITSDQQTPDLTSLLQNVIDLGTWQQGNNTVFKIEATGICLTDIDAKRRGESFEGNYASRLYYSYSFNAIAPVIEFETTTEISYVDGSDITLDIDVLDNGSGITKVDFYVDGTLTSTDTSAAYSFTNTYSDGSYFIEAIATDSNGVTGSTSIYINVGSFIVNDTNIIIDGNDDVEELANKSVYFTSSDLELIYDPLDGNGFQKIGLRFQNLNIPPGATISNAYIQFMADGDWNASNSGAEFEVFIEDSDNAKSFENNPVSNISGRSYFGASVNWSPQEWSNSDTTVDQQTPNISGLLQNVVDLNNWQQGNSTIFKIEATNASLTEIDAKRRAESFEGVYAPRLFYSYSYNAVLDIDDVLSVGISIYPNPVENTLNIVSSHDKILTVEVYDVRGRIVRVLNFNGEDSYQFNMSSLDSALYFLKFYTEKGIFIEQVVKI